MKGTELSVGELARACGTSVSALRFYESRGLLVSRRTPGNQRRYRADAVHRVGVILAAHAAGESIQAVAELLRPLPDHRAPTQREWTRIVAELRSVVTARLALLRMLRAASIEAGSSDLELGPDDGKLCTDGAGGCPNGFINRD